VIYLDSAATTAVRREVLEAMWPWLAGPPGNPSSAHDLGRAAALALADARASVAEILGCRASEVVFTSGGTESDNLALKGITLASARGRHVVTTAVEHPAVLESCDYLARYHGAEITIVGVDSTGLVDPDEIAAALRDDTALVAVMYANNEVGAVQPIASIAEAARARGIPMYTDAVQAAGCLDLSIANLGVDALGISGHKLGAPHGIGALAVRAGVPLEPLVHGGGQERGRRSGTEDVAAAVGLATALRLAVAPAPSTFIDDVLATVPSAILTGPREQRLPAHASFCFPGTSGESVLLELESRGIVCSSGSACAAGTDEPSEVLTAMGIPAEVAQTAVRFTWGAGVTAEELAKAVHELGVAVERVRALGA